MKILLAIDGSDCSTEVAKLVSEMTCSAGTELMVLSAVDFLEPLPSLEGIKRKELLATEKLVHSYVEQLRSAHPDAIVSGAVADGYACEEILDTCKEWAPDLVMVGSHGRSGLDYLFFGSVSRTVFLEAPCAVRIVRRKSEEHSEAGTYNVIVALEHTDSSGQVLDHVLSTPWSQKTNFRCVHVVRDTPESILSEPEGGYTHSMKSHYDNLVAGRLGWLEAAAAKLNDKLGRRAATAEILRGEPRKAILDLAKNWPADLILVGSHGRRGIDKAVLGSVSEAIAVHAQCSVEMTRVKTLSKKVHIIV
ncbi:MAG TPA: universal stress protein [Candidatus Melainabacteria bacterium]|jgi:nucleotide-binding universal stress UspA family protein|nr:universal stress protein [Candidatus Melainabacteria bacterium]HIN63182.1 universal stress protein [Candidatus Obscuribacterales bacterium]